jgi:hypothetical protein
MSIDDATPEEWDRMNFKRNKLGEPTFEEYMKRLNSQYVYNSTENYGKEVTSDAEDFADCWTSKDSDDVNSPAHYNYGNVECIEAIQESMTPEAFKGYLKGNTMKYLWRYERKGKQQQDLQKAQWYLNKLISQMEA